MLVNGRVRQSCSAMIDLIAPRADDHPPAMTKFPSCAISSSTVAHVRGPEARSRVDRARWLARSRAGRASRRTTGDGVSPVALHDVRCCLRRAAGGLDERLRRAGGAQPGAPLQPAPSGAMHAGERLDTVMGEGGVEGCGKAQNCVEVCPKDIRWSTRSRSWPRHDEAHAAQVAPRVVTWPPAGPLIAVEAEEATMLQASTISRTSTHRTLLDRVSDAMEVSARRRVGTKRRASCPARPPRRRPMRA